MAEISRERIEQLVRRPGESLVVEIKTWISPQEPAGLAKIVKGAIALRNRGGGYLLVGFNDKTQQQDRDGVPPDVRASFHVDIIQGLVAKYASEPFEIAVEFVEHEGLVHPVLVIPAGVRTPVAIRADLKDGDTFLLRTDDVYFRTLNSSNVVSTARIKWKDWRDLLDVCFDNREADIGRFLRRHLAGVDPATLAMAVTGNATAQRSIAERLESLMTEGLGRFRSIVKERNLTLPPHGSWEVGLIIDGEFRAQRDLQAFANLLSVSNPDYTGWPVWLSSRQFSDPESRPYVLDGGWEAMIVQIDPSFFSHVDFMRKDPRGRFYSYRALEDDISSNQNAPKPMRVLDAILPVLRTGEAIAVGLAFAKALQAEEHAKLEFMFRWNGLKDRVLTSWSDRMRYVTQRTTKQNCVTSLVTVPLDAPPSALGEYVKTAIQPLYEIFEGDTFPGSVVDELIQKLLGRRM
ncbi:helix-turn-helix domain-containing protein [Caballeronia sp. SL2Y3]|uniref:AlbA family DNA-binding domain-containing protein n=1 Tax=Caballeronia sp. SL2Y3 TaxID=2878151 RepID=UPI001FD5595A|nr:ATP-binding protein [Caballeronia sp. SL2Y3]